MNTDKILDVRQVAEAVNLSVATVRREARLGRFPPPIKLTSRRVGWRESVIRDLIAKNDPNKNRSALQKIRAHIDEINKLLAGVETHD